MRYHVLHIKTTFAEEWQKDVFDAQVCELGVDTIDGNDYYIQSELWEKQREDIEALCQMSGGAALEGAEACEDKNWNETWEAEHPIEELPLGIRIIPHCAFGAGHHETTAMMVQALITHQSYFVNRQIVNVLDHGTGTGVLAIFAKRLGADQVVAIDIDEKSVANAIENAELNGETIDVRLGGELEAFDFKPASFHLILANIHRNILLANMKNYSALLAEEGELWLSGFYEDDIDALLRAAQEEGLQAIEIHANNEWRMMQLRKSKQQ